jgi:hypothetical protein
MSDEYVAKPKLPSYSISLSEMNKKYVLNKSGRNIFNANTMERDELIKSKESRFQEFSQTARFSENALNTKYRRIFPEHVKDGEQMRNNLEVSKYKRENRERIFLFKKIHREQRSQAVRKVNKRKTYSVYFFSYRNFC